MRHLSTPARQHAGVSLLQVLLLVAVLSTLAVMAYLSSQKRAMVQGARQEQHVLAQANRALVTFATTMHRLPCPDTDRDGLENCESPLQKGWLPARSLKQAGADAGVGMGQLRYLVQRGAGDDDLSVRSDSWRPLSYEEGPQGFFAMRAASDYQEGIVTLADFCQRLGLAAAAPYASGRAAVRSSPRRTVAYALAHPGMQGNTAAGSLFDGANETALNEVEEANYAPTLAQYDDVVLARSYASLREHLGCQGLIDSINLIALAEDVSADVEDKRQGSIVDAKKAIAFAAIGAAITAIETASTVPEGISDAVNAGGEWALCAASLGLAVNACAAAPLHTAAVGFTGGVVALNIVSIAANIVAAVKAGEALALADNSVDAGSFSCPNVVGPEEAIAALEAEVVDAEAALQALEDEIRQKEQDLPPAIEAKTQATNRLWSAVHFTASSSSIDGIVAALLAAADGQYSAQILVDRTAAQIDSLEETVANYTANLADYNHILANYTGTENTAALLAAIAQLQQEIDALQTQMDALNPSADEEQLQALREQQLQKIARRTQLTDYRDSGDPKDLLAEAENARDKLAQAQSDLNAALQAHANNQQRWNAADTAYQQAYESLLNHGPYLSDALVLFACTSISTSSSPALCTTELANTTAAIYLAIAQLMGGDGTKGPLPKSRFTRPDEIQREITALKQLQDPLKQRITYARSNLAEAQAAATDMPVCTISVEQGVGPMPEALVKSLLMNADRKGGTR